MSDKKRLCQVRLSVDAADPTWRAIIANKHDVIDELRYTTSEKAWCHNTFAYNFAKCRPPIFKTIFASSTQ